MEALDRLLRPRSIAVVGGGAWCENVIEQCRKIEFAGPVWPVHPSRDAVAGVPAFRDIDALPDAPDATFIGVNRDATIDVVGALAARAAGGAVCFASGFREAVAELADGGNKQAALLEAAGEMPILGPNCYGFINYLDGAALWPDQHGGVRVERGVAIVTQSSNIALNLTMQRRGLPLAYVVTVGNQGQQGVSNVAAALLRDDRVTAIGLHIEGIDDLRQFEAFAAQAAIMGKPVVALKVGKSDQARAATISHTASLAGSDAGARALFRRLGIGQVQSLSDMLETLKLLHVAGPLPSNRIASMSCSGGEACLMADTVVGKELEFPPLEKSQSEALRAALGARVALANPLDYHTYIWGDEEGMAATFTAMMSGDVAMGCVVLDVPRADRCDPSAWDAALAAVARARDASGKPVAVLGSIAEALPEDMAVRLTEAGLVPFMGMPEAVQAMEVAAIIGSAKQAAEPLCLPPETNDGTTLTERAAKEALGAFGVDVPRAQRVERKEVAPTDVVAGGPRLRRGITEDEGRAFEKAAADIGWPVVLKAEGVAHKTEAGAVALHLATPVAVRLAAETMPGDSFLVEEMIPGTVAELLIGVVADAHGYVLTLGAGGTLTELLEDATSLLVPASREDVRAALGRLRMAPLLHGYRGKSAANIDAVLDAIMAVQAYVQEHRPQEVEINPLICTSDRAIAADALIRLGDET